MRRRSTLADRERDHTLLAVPIVGDDAPASGVVAVSEAVAERQGDHAAVRDGFRREHRGARVVVDNGVPAGDPHSVIEDDPDTARRLVEHRAVGRNRSQQRCVRRRDGRERKGGDRNQPDQTPGAARVPPEHDASLAAPMPIYEYKCPNGHLFDAFHGMTEPGPTVCTVCGEGPLQVVLHPVAVHYKGSGFYSTDYGRKSKQPAKDSGSGESSSARPRRVRWRLRQRLRRLGGKGETGGGDSGGESKKAAEA